MMRSSVGRYLRFSFAATAAVTIVPFVAAFITYLNLTGESRWAPAMLVAAAVCVVVAAVGTSLWKSRPESADVCFGELLAWRFFRRARAEERLNESARALGLDLGGRPLRRTQMSATERLKILHSLAAALESKDPYTHGHSTRVEHLAVRTAKTLGLSEREIEDLKTAASLHDVGKIRIPTRILRKPSPLTVEEKIIVQEHSSVGAWMVSGVSNRRVVMSVRHHHERWDGNGYPDGVPGRDIPLFARIIAVADSFDAMTSNRPYRNGLSKDKAIEEIRLEAGTQFDPVVVDAFLASQPKRVAVPAFLAPGVMGLLGRKIAAWAKRVGSTQAAETLVGAGVGVVVAASVFLPPAASPSESQTPGQGIAPPSVEVGEDTGGVALMDSVGAKVLRSKENVVGNDLSGHRKARRGDATREGDGRRFIAGDWTPGGETTPRGGETPPGDDLEFPDAGSQPGPGKGPGEKPEHPETPPAGGGGDEEPEAPAPTKPPKKEKTHTDPQPDHGRDCVDHPGRGNGGGNARHCG